MLNPGTGLTNRGGSGISGPDSGRGIFRTYNEKMRGHFCTKLKYGFSPAENPPAEIPHRGVLALVYWMPNFFPYCAVKDMKLILGGICMIQGGIGSG